MKTYELTYILSSGISSDDAEAVKKDFETFIQGKEGVVLKSQKTVPQSLAYVIKKNSSGYFVTLEFQVAEPAITEITAKLGKDTNVLRHALLVKKPAKQMKKRRTKPVSVAAKLAAIVGIGTDKKTKEVKVESADIDKKLDEILSE